MASQRGAQQKQQKRQAGNADLNAKDRREVQGHQSLRSTLIYEVVRREGEEELARPTASLWWSGTAAGFGISLSLIVQGAMHSALPEADWRILVSALGYTTGFVIVVLGRLQLFTENTITAVLPLLAAPSLGTFGSMLRLWAVVFAANMVGTLCVAGVAFVGGLPPDVYDGMLTISEKLTGYGFFEALCYGIPSGFLVAAIVWLLPSAGTASLGVVILLTYAIGVGGFTHVVAGALDLWLLVLEGEVGPAHAVGGMLLPVLIGNVTGGTGLFALVAYGQVREEINGDEGSR